MAKFALASAHPRADHLRRVYTRGRVLELPEFDMERLLDAWQDAVFGLYLAEEKIETGSRREHAELGTQRLQCRPVGPFASGRSSWYRAARAVHDSLSFQSLSVGEGERHRADRLPSREAGLPGLSRPEGRWDASGSAAEFPDPATARFPGAASPANWARSTFHRRARI